MGNRRSIRLEDYDYAQDGAYFVTICTAQRIPIFGNVDDGEMILNTLGCVAEDCWFTITDHASGVELDAFVIMPNHIHGVVIINRWERARHAVPLQTHGEAFGKPVAGSLPTLIGSYKSAVTRKINQIRLTPGHVVWQRNYFEHVIRNEVALDRIREYILYNPARWSEDTYFVS